METTWLDERAQASFSKVRAEPAPDSAEQVRARRARIERWREQATDFWQASHEIGGTLAAEYLASIGVRGPVSSAIRFAPAAINRDTGERGPALIALLSLPRYRQMGAIARTFLDPVTGTARGRDVFGSLPGAAVHMGAAGAEMVVAATIETALLARQMLGISAIAAAGQGHMELVRLPRTLRHARWALGHATEISRAELAAAAALAVRCETLGVEFAIEPPPAPFETWSAAALAARDGGAL